MAKGKEYTTNPSAPPGNAKSQGGSSTGKKASLNNSNLTSRVKNIGTPQDKGVNR